MKLVAVQGLWLVGAALLLAVAPIAAPTARVGLTSAIAAGAIVGTVAFAVLAAGARLRRPPAAIVAVAVAVATTEEIVWRWGAVAGTRPLLGAAGAVALGTLGFAFGHVPLREPRRLPPFLLLGASFGLVFLATGRLAAAVAAHGFYNALAVSQERA